ncbi:MAG: hypothetical protein HKN14_04170 [Marinicaulis sp.]|nr:hypothetical protein [Marinicaulis sp.]NNE40096.1 hypothetical protein [Marinicaulis sp.]NNL88417.1 hypothetical protein [Marinicaulis sp.]
MKKFYLILIAILLSGCQTLSALTGDKNIETAAATDMDAENAASAEDEVATPPKTIDGLDQLADAQLPSKSCGMILWTLDAQRPTPVFRYVAGEDAEISVGGTPIQLIRTSHDGYSVYGVFESQEFTSAVGVSVEVETQFGLGFDNGVYLERGVVKVTGVDGWSVVSPAAGVAGCRS